MGDAAETPGTLYAFEGTSPFRPERGTYHFSMYGDLRWKPYNSNSFIGPMPAFTVLELDLMRAEALYRTGDRAGAVAIINNTRTAAGLPAATVDGVSGDRCTPKPDGVNCADLWEAIKYEKRLEEFHTGMGLHFYDDRGWGDLVSGTAIRRPWGNGDFVIIG